MPNQPDPGVSGGTELKDPHSDPFRDEVDLSLLEVSLSKTPWERMLANDDALRFAEELRVAMEKRNAEFNSTG